MVSIYRRCMCSRYWGDQRLPVLWLRVQPRSPYLLAERFSAVRGVPRMSEIDSVALSAQNRARNWMEAALGALKG